VADFCRAASSFGGKATTVSIELAVLWPTWRRSLRCVPVTPVAATAKRCHSVAKVAIDSRIFDGASRRAVDEQTPGRLGRNTSRNAFRKSFCD